MPAHSSRTILALDVGTKRIGVASANAEVRFAAPFSTLDHTETIYTEIARLIDEQEVAVLVVGLPRGLNGQDTAQTKYVRDFIEALMSHIAIPVVMQDEALTSNKAETELAARGKMYTKGDVDALAATYILEDYIVDHPKEVS